MVSILEAVVETSNVRFAQLVADNGNLPLLDGTETPVSTELPLRLDNVTVVSLIVSALSVVELIGLSVTFNFSSTAITCVCSAFILSNIKIKTNIAGICSFMHAIKNTNIKLRLERVALLYTTFNIFTKNEDLVVYIPIFRLMENLLFSIMNINNNTNE